jgi:hypothetical protein
MDNLNSKIKQVLNKSEQDVPPIVWDKLEAQLYPKSKSRAWWWLWLVVPCILTVSYLLYSKYTFKPAAVVANKSVEIKPNTNYNSKPNQTAIPINSTELKDTTTVKSVIINNKLLTSPLEAPNNNKKYNDDNVSAKQETELNFETLLSLNHKGDLLNNQIIRNKMAPKQLSLFNNTIQPISIQLSANNTSIINKIELPTDTITPIKNNKPTQFISVRLGYNLFKSKLFSPYLNSGILSNTKGTYSGFGISIEYIKPIRKLNIMGGINVIQQSSNVRGNLITNQNGFNSYLKNKALSLSQLESVDCNNYFIIKNVELQYTYTQVAASVGAAYNFNINKFSVIPSAHIIGVVGSKIKASSNIISNYSSNQVYLTGIDAQLRLGVLYNLKKWSIGISPSIQQSVFSNWQTQKGGQTNIVLPIECRVKL